MKIREAVVIWAAVKILGDSSWRTGSKEGFLDTV